MLYWCLDESISWQKPKSQILISSLGGYTIRILSGWAGGIKIDRSNGESLTAKSGIPTKPKTPHLDIQVQNVQAVNVTEAFQDLLDEGSDLE